MGALEIAVFNEEWESICTAYVPVYRKFACDDYWMPWFYPLFPRNNENLAPRAFTHAEPIEPHNIRKCLHDHAAH